MTSDLRKLSDLDFVSRGDGDYDVVAGGAVIELSRDEDGAWTFWGVRVGKQQMGGTQTLGPGEFHDWLNAIASSEQVT